VPRLALGVSGRVAEIGLDGSINGAPIYGWFLLGKIHDLWMVFVMLWINHQFMVPQLRENPSIMGLLMGNLWKINGEIHLQMDDEQGYPYDLGNPKI
jgi:hypothetical protein